MATQKDADFPSLERAIIKTIRTLNPSRAALVLDFARWLSSQATNELTTEDDSPAALEAEESEWQATYLANRDQFRSMAREALEELEAGNTFEMVIENDKIRPQ